MIFATAYDRYALQAFETHAVDYLLKPVGSARFNEALQWARQTLGREEALEAAHRRTVNIIDPARSPSPAATLRRLTVKDAAGFCC